MLLDFQKEVLGKFMVSSPELYGGQFINLDFHGIPHHGNEVEMEKIWCGSKHKSMKAANTVFAQESKSNMMQKRYSESLSICPAMLFMSAIGF